jgi:hypothetical protein
VTISYMNQHADPISLLFASIVSIAAMTTGTPAEPSQYLCTTDQTAGLHYDKQTGEWRPQAFGAGAKYVLRRLSETDRRKWYWFTQREFSHEGTLLPEKDWGFFYSSGDRPPLAKCGDAGYGVFWCTPIGTSYVEFDMDSRRFTIGYLGAYIDQAGSEQLRREHPEVYDHLRTEGAATDPSHPDDLFVEIGKCSPS